MYLRTTRRRNSDGSAVQYYQLAENVWDRAKGCAVAKVVYNFGRADALDRATLQRLARSILRVFAGEEALAAEPDVRVLDAWPFGVVHVVETLWGELELDTVLGDLQRRQATDQPFARALRALVTHRVHRPGPKRACQRAWQHSEVSYPGGARLELQHLYRAMDFFEAHKAAIEQALYFRTADLMRADVDLIFYDTTSLHFEIDMEDEGVQRRCPTPRGDRRSRTCSRRTAYARGSTRSAGSTGTPTVC